MKKQKKNYDTDSKDRSYVRFKFTLYTSISFKIYGKDILVCHVGFV